MKLIFAHDHIFKTTNSGCVYSPGKLSNKSFERYLDSFSSVTIVSRFEMVAEAKVESFNKIDLSQVSFNGFDNQSTLSNRFFKRAYYKSKLKKLLSCHDGLVVRIPSEIGFLAAEAALELNKPYVCEVVACPRDAMLGFNNFKSKLYMPIITRAMKQCLDNAQGALYVTDSFLQERYPCKGNVEVASNVDIQRTHSKDRSFNIEAKEIINIALIGDLNSSHKGYNTLFSAAKILSNNSNRKFKFFIVGPGDKYKLQLNLNNTDFIYPGSLKPNKILDLLDEMDVYIQPSNQEGLPRATIEAMSRSLPCVVSNAGGLPELIDSQHVHAVDNAGELATKIAELVATDKLYWEQSAKNRFKAERFTASLLSEVRARFFSKYKSSLLEVT